MEVVCGEFVEGLGIPLRGFVMDVDVTEVLFDVHSPII